MKIISIITDELLHADSVLMEMSIEEYLSIGKRILNNNQYQRRRVKDSKSVYTLLRQDIKALCTIPTIVLAYDGKYEGPNLTLQSSTREIEECMSYDNLIILDGLQRTYTMIDASSDLLRDAEDAERFMRHIIRVEVYIGLSKTGILYRMLTLNTGQTPMSKRHEIEILYSDLLNTPIGNIQLVRQVSNEKAVGIDSYDFDDVIEGFNSFIEQDESPLSKKDLLDIVLQLNMLTKNEYDRDLFSEFIVTYNRCVHIINDLSRSWVFDTQRHPEIKSIYGSDIPRFFNKSQTISAFGAAVGLLISEEKLECLDSTIPVLGNVKFENEAGECFSLLLANLQEIRERAKKIGVEQRLYLKLFFYNLLDQKSDSFAQFKASVEKSFNEYRIKQWKSDTTQQMQLF